MLKDTVTAMVATSQHQRCTIHAMLVQMTIAKMTLRWQVRKLDPEILEVGSGSYWMTDIQLCLWNVNQIN